MSKSIASSYLSSSRKSFASTILKKPQLCSRKSDGSRVNNFKLPSNLHLVFDDVVQKSDKKQYEELVSAVRDFEIKDDELYIFLREVRKNIAVMNKSLYHFVDALLKLKWAHRSQVCSSEYGAFLVDLLSTHNYYTRKVLEILIETFKSEECYETVDGVLSEKAVHCCSNLHNVLGILLRVIPMASHVLCEVVRIKCPYLKRAAQEQKSFVSNILKICEYFPDLQCELFHLLIERLILLDVNAPKTELYDAQDDCPSEASEMKIFDMEDSSVESSLNPIAQSLDLTLEYVFRYMYSTCHNVSDSGGSELVFERAFQFYNNLVAVFNEIILPTDSTHHIQFLLFYLCSFNESLLGNFVDYLWDKALREEEDLVTKQKSVAYLVGMIARAKFVSISLAQKILGTLATWVHNYIDRRERQNLVCSDLRRHPFFYSLCQAIFYLVSVRHCDLLHPKRNLEFVLKLNLTKIVSSQLNPLRVCLPEVIESFARVANAYQLAYCDPIIEQNSRSELPIIHHDEHGTVLCSYPEKEVLNAYFPFDKFLLPRSKEIIAPLYREDEDFMETSLQSTAKCEDDDDFMSEQLSSSIPGLLTRLSVSES